MKVGKYGPLLDVALAIAGSLVAPPIYPVHLQRYFGGLKVFGAVDELVTIVTVGAPCTRRCDGANLERALQYGNHPSVNEHLPVVWEKNIGEGVRRQKCVVIQKSAAHEIPNLRVSPLAAVVAYKVRIIYDLSFDEQRRRKKGGLNGDTDPATVPQCLCAHALRKFLDELVALRKKFPVEKILMSKANVADAFRNVRVDPDQAQTFCYTVGELVVIGFRLTFGWSGSPGFWGVMFAAANDAHCNTILNLTQLLDEVK